MRLERIEVESRDEYRDGEEPRGFVWREESFRIAKILDRWYEGSMDARRMALRYFKVETVGGGTFILRYHETFRSWSIVAPVEAGE